MEVSVTKSMSVSGELLPGTQILQGRIMESVMTSNLSGLCEKMKRNSAIVDFISVLGLFPFHEFDFLLALL